MVLGVEIPLDEALETSELIPVGHAKGRQYSSNYIAKWIHKSWSGGLTTQTEVIILTKGWFMVRFTNEEALEWVLERNWGFGNSPIFFKKWMPLFDAQRERLKEILV